MVDIGSLDKIINLWPSPASRPIDKYGKRKKSLKDQRHSKKNPKESDIQKDGPGKNIDEYV